MIALKIKPVQEHQKLSKLGPSKGHTAWSQITNTIGNVHVHVI